MLPSLVTNRARGMIGCALLAALPATALHAKIDLVTLPSKDKSELTIYNSEDLTLVRESRTLSFSEGLNEIQFSWANTLIDPTSLQIELGNVPGLTVLDAVYPANTTQLIVWNIEAEEDMSAPVEISYFCSGLSWTADYIIMAGEDRTNFSLQQFTTVKNDSGEDFENAATRVVIGEINLVELIADLARRGIMVDESVTRDRMARGMMLGRAEADVMAAAPMFDEMRVPKEIMRKAVSEYHVLAVEGEETILNGWRKKLPSPVIPDVPFELSYEINPRKHGNNAVLIYKFKNDEDHELGKDPLPEGNYYVYTHDGRGGIRFEGSTNHRYIPIGDEVELNLGSDGMLLLERKLLDYKRSDFDLRTGNCEIIGWLETRTVRLELKNSREQAVPVKLTEYLEGDWSFDNVSDSDWRQLDTESVRWEIEVPARSTHTIEYTVTQRIGSRSRR